MAIVFELMAPLPFSIVGHYSLPSMCLIDLFTCPADLSNGFHSLLSPAAKGFGVCGVLVFCLSVWCLCGFCLVFVFLFPVSLCFFACRSSVTDCTAHRQQSGVLVCLCFLVWPVFGCLFPVSFAHLHALALSLTGAQRTAGPRAKNSEFSGTTTGDKSQASLSSAAWLSWWQIGKLSSDALLLLARSM